MLTVETLREYLNLPPDEGDAIAELCLNAAKSKAKAASRTIRTMPSMISFYAHWRGCGMTTAASALLETGTQARRRARRR